MAFVVETTRPIFESLADYPPWLVIACATIVVAAGIWLLAKLIKWTLWVMMAAVLLVGGTVLVGMLVL